MIEYKDIREIIKNINAEFLLDNAPTVGLVAAILIVPIYIISKKYLDTNYDQFKPLDVTKYIQDFKRFENDTRLPEEKNKNSLF